MRAKRLLVSALLLAAAGCGEAAWNPDLKATAPLDRGAPFVEALAQHGCPDSVQEIDSETFTATWERTRLVAAAPLYVKREGSSLAYLFRKGKVSGAHPSTEPGEALPPRSAAGLLPLLAVFAAWIAGRSLGERARVAKRPLVVLAALLVASLTGTERTGANAAGGGAAEGSPAGTIVDELGAPTSVLKLPGDAGALLVYRAGERKRAVIGGTETAATQAFLVQRGRVVARSAKTTTLQAQYYLAPFTGSEGLRFEIAWSVLLGTLALLFATRARRKPVESAPPTP